MPFIVFHEPYYTSCVRNYVASQMPTGDIVTLFDDDGEAIAAEVSPGEHWPEYLAARASALGYELSADDVANLPTQETFDHAESAYRR